MTRGISAFGMAPGALTSGRDSVSGFVSATLCRHRNRAFFAAASLLHPFSRVDMRAGGGPMPDADGVRDVSPRPAGWRAP